MRSLELVFRLLIMIPEAAVKIWSPLQTDWIKSVFESKSNYKSVCHKINHALEQVQVFL
jgi:hypothetical protein